MWEVVGFRLRNVQFKDGQICKYFDLYLEREASEPAQGLQVIACDYAADRFTYRPKIGDRVFAAFGRSKTGRLYLSDLQVVPNV